MCVSPETYIADMLKQANWHILPHESANRYPAIDLNTDILKKVDVVLFSTEPFHFTEQHIHQFKKDFPEHASKARLINGEMLSWYGSRSIKGLGYLTNFAAR